METQENKIIREKLNAITGLPAGYQANLDSKWTLLEAALDGNRKRKAFAWQWVAAALVLVILPAGWLMRFQQNKETMTATKQTVNSQVRFHMAILEFIPAMDLPEEKTTYAAPQLSKNMVQTDTTTVKEKEVQENETPVLVNEKTEPLQEPLAEKSKPTQKRFAECDFTGGLPPGTIYSQPTAASRSLKFRLGNVRPSNTTVHNTKRVAIRQSL